MNKLPRPGRAFEEVTIKIEKIRKLRESGMSYPQIAEKMGYRDHTTPRHLYIKYVAQQTPRARKNAEHNKVTRKYYRENSARMRYMSAKRRCEMKGLGFTMTLEEYEGLLQLPCDYCGEKTPSQGVDRLNSKLGYIQGNIAPCCRYCNMMKGSSTDTEFIEHCRKIANLRAGG